MRAVFAENLATLLRKRYPSAKNDTARNREYGKDSGIAKKTVRRWLIGEVSPNLDQIELAARSLKIQPYQLLVPGFGVGESLSSRPFRPTPGGRQTPQPSISRS